MNDFSGILPSDFNLRSQGKSASMAARSASTRSSGKNVNFDPPTTRSNTTTTSSWSSTPTGASFDQSSLFGNNNPNSQIPSGAFDDILGGSGVGTVKRPGKSSDDVFNFDWSGRVGGGEKSSVAAATAPVYDKPVYDEDVFDGVPGLKSSNSVKFDDVFSSITSPSNESGPFDDLLGSLGRKGPESKTTGQPGFGKGEEGIMDFEDLIPGFGGSSPSDRSTVEVGLHPRPTAPSAKSTSNTMDDPFVVLESPSPPEVSSSGKSANPLEQFSDLSNSENVKVQNLSRSSGVFDDLNPLDGLGKTIPAYSSEMSTRDNSISPLKTGPRASGTQNSFGEEPAQKPSARIPDNQPQRTMPIDNNLEFQQAFSGMPRVSSDPYKSVGPTSSPPSYDNLKPKDTKIQTGISSQFEENLESSDDVWLTVSEIPLFTEPTRAPPPSRPPPPRPVQISKGETASFDSRTLRKKVNEFSAFSNPAQYVQSSKSGPTTVRGSGVSEIDELEDFAIGRTQNNVDEGRDTVSVEEVEASSAAAAMKEAMDRAEAKFRHAKEVRERENVKASRSKEAGHFERDEKSVQDAQAKVIREKQERLDQERQQREREEEREQKRLEMERAREIERERGMARQAVERATREARERAAAEARLKAERAAVGKANAEARERAERVAVQRAHAEAHERAAAEAQGRAEKAAAEVREKEARERAAVARAEAEARHRAERAAVERAAAEARERAASSARANQQKNENDFESFFSMGGRPSSAPRPRANSSESAFDTQFQNKQGSEAAKRTSTGVSSSIRKASSTANIVDDLTSIFGAAPSSGEFQEVEGETEERRRARLERNQRTQERAAKALAEKNERDLQTLRDQAERHRIAETLDVEIKRWAAGKEGNLRALLSTLQYVLWPECGWQPVSLTDLITGASVKKFYRKATLCIHPDKVQQKGANLQQKYIAEKVFDLLKEAWNKLNSEELF